MATNRPTGGALGLVRDQRAATRLRDQAQRRNIVRVISAPGRDGWKSARFDGPAGVFDIKARHTIAAGVYGRIKIYVNELLFASHRMDEDGVAVLTRVPLAPGDRFSLKGVSPGADQFLTEPVTLTQSATENDAPDARSRDRGDAPRRPPPITAPEGRFPVWSLARGRRRRGAFRLTGAGADPLIYAFDLDRGGAAMELEVRGRTARLTGSVFGGLLDGDGYDHRDSGLWRLEIRTDSTGRSQGRLQQLFGAEREIVYGADDDASLLRIDQAAGRARVQAGRWRRHDGSMFDADPWSFGLSGIQISPVALRPRGPRYRFAALLDIAAEGRRSAAQKEFAGHGVSSDFGALSPLDANAPVISFRAAKAGGAYSPT